MDRIAATNAFIRSVEVGSFTAVAREMNTTQSTISKLVAGLESNLGVQLLTRTTRSLALTEEGRRFYEQARTAIDAFAAAESAARGEQGARGTLRLGCPVAFGQSQIVPRLKKFLERHGDIKIDMVMSDVVLDPVEQGEDVVIRIGELPDSTLLARRIGLTKRVAVASPNYLDAQGRPEKPEALKEHDCILYTRLASGSEWPFQTSAGTVSIRVSGRIRVDNSAALIGLLLDGLGIGMVPLWAVADELRSGRLERILDPFEPVPLPIHAVSPPRRFTPPKVTAFVEFMAEEFRGDPYVSDGYDINMTQFHTVV